MKKLLLLLVLFTFTVLCVSPTFAQYEPSMQFGLPEGAIARFGKGEIQNMTYSPDGTRFAVTTSIGVWIYNAQTGEELDLITRGHKGRVYAAAYSPDSKTITTVGEDKTVRLWDAYTGQLQKTLKGHKGRVYAAAHSPDGNILATGSADKTVRLWNAHTGKKIKTLKGHTESVLSIAFSPDGAMFATASDNSPVRIWNVHSRKLIHKITGYRNMIAYSPDGRTLLVAHDPNYNPHRRPNAVGVVVLDTIYEVHMLDTFTGQVVKTLPSLNYVNCSAYSPDGKTIAISDGQRFGLWDATTGKHLKTLSEGTPEVKSIAYSPDGKTIATASWEGTMRWWNAQTGENIKTFARFEKNYGPIGYSPDGKTIAITDGRDISLWHAISGMYLTTLEGHKDYISGFTFSSDSKTIASGSNDGTARLWNANTGENIKTLVGHKNHASAPIHIDTLVFSPDGNMLAARSKDTAWLWNAHTGEIIMTLNVKTFFSNNIAFSPDSKILATRFKSNSVQLWDINTGKNINTLIGHVYSFRFSPDGKSIATCTYNMVKLWDTITGENINTLLSPNALHTAVLHLHGKPFAITTYEDKTSSLWDVTSGQLIKKYKRPGDSFYKFFRWLPREKISRLYYEIQYSPISNTFVTIADHTPVRLWNITTGKLIGKPLKHLKGENGYIRVMYSPDGKTIATIPVGDNNQGGTVRLWDVATGEHIKTLKGHSNCNFESVAYSPDSKTIATGHRDGTVLLWDIPHR